MNVVFIGSGNVAVSLSFALYRAGHTITQVWSRSKHAANQMLETLHANGCSNTITAICQWEDMRADADLYVVAVTDEAVAMVAQALATVWQANASLPARKRICVHTACTLPYQVLEPLQPFAQIGVLYPFQTFTKSRMIDVSNVPFFIEGDNDSTTTVLKQLAAELSTIVYQSDLQMRMYLHLAGVMAGNFTNCLYAMAKDILNQANLPFELLFPIIDETAQKVHTISPRSAQTGPAVRGDQQTINKHLEIINSNELRDLYALFTRNIQENNGVSQPNSAKD